MAAAPQAPPLAAAVRRCERRTRSASSLMEPLRPDVGELADRFGPRRVARAADMQQRPPALRRHASLRRFSTPQPRSRPGTQRRRLVRSAPVQMDVEGRTNATSVEYWDNLAETWNSEVHDSLLEDERHVIRAALDEFVAGADVVLDLGCGAGNYLHALASRAASVVGVDISPRCVEQARQLCARRRLQNCRLHVADLGRCAGAEAFQYVCEACSSWASSPRFESLLRKQKSDADEAT
eukprot:TRINITY_DN14997_c0_g1_i3.p1 TRINITY_DN14997_c0_g1~~TRINITY_DN14997_c0_g1_i3.p1  ORF type:complete len:238 (-),score=46.92 TRINITY_DN14997_c0_g1_i3:51-764(-)